MNKSYLKMLLFSVVAVASLAMFSTVAQAAPSPEDQKTIAELKKTYPIDTCVVSGDKLEGGLMGAPVDYLYKTKVDGKDTVRLLRFCCGGCIKTFLKAPEKYLKMIDDASKTKKVSSNDATPTSQGGMGCCAMGAMKGMN